MARRALRILTIFCCFLCMAVAILWVRSYWVWEGLSSVSVVSVADSDPSAIIKCVTRLHVSSNMGALSLWISGSNVDFRDGSPLPSPGWEYLKRRAEKQPVVDNLHQPHILFHMAGMMATSRSEGIDPSGRASWVLIPYWMFLPILLLLPILHVRRIIRQRLRLKRGQCLNCGYDLRASKDKCPECGMAIPLNNNC